MAAAAVALVLVLALASCSSDAVTDGAPATAGTSDTDVPPASGVPGSTPGTTTGVATGAPRPSAGCGLAPVAAVSAERHTLEIAGVERFYLLTTPDSAADAPLPLVLDLHGLAEGAQVHTAMSDFGTLAQAEGFVVAFPNGTGQPVRWDADTTSDPNDDLAFFDQLVDQIETDLCIDTSRVYATGLSYGAIMSSFLTCVRADEFAAVAPVAGITVPDDCHPSRPMPVITFHGTADPILKFNGGVDLGSISPGGADGATTTTVVADLDGPGYPEAVREWAARNDCDPDPTDTEVAPDVVHRVYDCPPDAAVEFYIVEGGGHAWPGSAFSASIETVVGPTTMDISATDLIWAFFQRFQLP